MGLSISREIIEEKHGGTIDFESEPGGGTTFHIRIPLRADKEQRPVNRMVRTASSCIVDDEEMVITSIRAFLQLETEFEIRGFTDPVEAAEFAASNPVDVVVSDYLMPKLNGIQLLAKVKEAQPETSRVLLTGPRRQAERDPGDQRGGAVPVPRKAVGQLAASAGGAERRRARPAAARAGRKGRGTGLRELHLKTVQRRLIEAFL